MVNKKILVKKLWSLNPTKYKKITLKDASNQYDEYVSLCVLERFSFKTFIDWLGSEI
jgi:hypothetical protein